MFALIEEGRLIKIQQAPSDPDIGDDFVNASPHTLRAFGWYPVVIDRAEVGPEQTRSDDIIVVDGDVVRVIQTVRDLSDEEVFHKTKNHIFEMIENIEHQQSDRSERELLLELAEHLSLTQSHAYNNLKEIDERISSQRRTIAKLQELKSQ